MLHSFWATLYNHTLKDIQDQTSIKKKKRYIKTHMAFLYPQYIMACIGIVGWDVGFGASTVVLFIYNGHNRKGA